MDHGLAVVGNGTAVQAKRRSAMRLHLHLVRGSSFCSTDEGGVQLSAHGYRWRKRLGRRWINTDVWSKLPPDLKWEVVLRLPAVKHVQLRVVSREWRKMLTSALFRDRAFAVATRRAGSREKEQRRVVACVDVANSGQGDSRCCSDSSKNLKKLKVLDIDLSCFVPDWFWASDCSSYSVVATGDGLVCISNDSKLPGCTRYCLLNPVTRTCVVLPPLPFDARVWYPPGSAGIAGSVTICGWSDKSGSWDLATYSHGTGGGGSGVWVVTRNPSALPACHGGRRRTPVDAMLGTGARGQTYRYDYDDHRVHVLAPPAGAGADTGPSGSARRCRHVEVCALDAPSGAPIVGRWWKRELDRLSVVVANRGAVSLVSQLISTDYLQADRACGAWRLLAGGDGQVHPEWQLVAFLDGPGLRRLTSVGDVDDTRVFLDDAYAAGELLCCRVSAARAIPGDAGFGDWLRIRCLLGFDLDTGTWEVVPGGQNLGPRPDLVLVY